MRICYEFEDELSCTIDFRRHEIFCTDDKPLKVNVVNDKIKNRELKQLRIEIPWIIDDNETFCLPRFIDMPSAQQLVIRSDDIFGLGTKLNNTNTFIEMLRDMNSSKFEFQYIEPESIRDFFTKDL